MSDESYAIASDYTTPYSGGLWLNREDCTLIADLLDEFVLAGGDTTDPLYDRADAMVRLCREVTA